MTSASMEVEGEWGMTMTKNAVVFSGRNGLDFADLRMGILRIPEVTLRLREAQYLLEQSGIEIDLLNVITADDEFFFRNIKLKSLLAAIVQVGLFDRFLKTQRFPDFLVGNSNGDSALLVCSGQMSFKEMIESSQAHGTLKSLDDKPAENVVPFFVVEATPLLSGHSLTEYSAFQAMEATVLGRRSPCESVQFASGGGAGAVALVDAGRMDIKKIVAHLFAEQNVVCFVNIGPASALSVGDYRSLGSDEVESLDSIELDPMLGWFWRGVGSQPIALAQ